jgi:hypothetical protein
MNYAILIFKKTDLSLMYKKMKKFLIKKSNPINLQIVTPYYTELSTAFSLYRKQDRQNAQQKASSILPAKYPVNYFLRLQLIPDIKQLAFFGSDLP